jgi:capsular exopolysaccharide synthesis family protein
MYLDINTKREDLKISIEELNTALKRGIDNITFSSFNSVNSSTLSTFIAERNRANQEYLSLKKLFRNRHPKLIKSKSNLDQVSLLVRSEIIKILNGLKREYTLLSDRESVIEKEIEEQKLSIINNDDKVIKVNTINKNLDIEKDLYNKVVTRLSEATLVKGLETNHIKIIESARIPTSAVSSGKFKKIVLGLIATLGFGTVLAIFADKLDKRFKSIDEVEGYLGIHFIGLIPTHKTKSKQPVTLYDPYARTSEAFRFIRTWLSNSAPGNPKKILLTSSLPGEGKSHTATNLSISFAQLGYSVILIDSDLRRPKLHQNLNLSSNKGLVDILAYNASWQTVVQETDLENLRVITAGGVPHNPAELLSTDRMKYLLTDLEKAFDIVIVDAPIALTIPDVSILTPFIDGILLIHDPDKGTKELALETKKILDRANAPILGIVFNNVSLKKQNQYVNYQSYYSREYSNQKNRTRNQENKLIDMRPTENKDAWVSAGSSGKDSRIDIS